MSIVNINNILYIGIAREWLNDDEKERKIIITIILTKQQHAKHSTNSFPLNRLSCYTQTDFVIILNVVVAIPFSLFCILMQRI